MELSSNPQLIPILAFGSVFLLVYGWSRSSSQRSERLARQLGRFANSRGGVVDEAGTAGVFRQRRRTSRFRNLDSFLERKGFAANTDDALARADLPLRVGEYLLIRWLVALGLGFGAAMFFRIPLAAVPAAAIGYMLPAVFVSFRTKRRAGKLDEQLVDAMMLMAGGLRAGYSFLQGAEAVVRELDNPIRQEFGTLLQDLRVGVQMEEALASLSRRTGSEEFDMMVTAVLVQRQSGGNLAEILETIAHTIRERMRIRREVQTLTAQERWSAYLVGSLPIVAFTFLTFVNPAYLDLLFATDTGRMLLAGSIGLEVLGFFIIRRIIDIRI
jgi:tight adherence protein B